MKKIFVLVGHPDSNSNSAEFGRRYVKGAQAAGHEVRMTILGEITFDPILHQGYRAIQALEPDLATFQENIKWADHFVLIYPTWWSAPPALLKGLIDRAWLPGFAFRFKKEGLGKGYFWYRLLKGKTARMFVSSDSPPLVLKTMYGETTNAIRWGVLWFSGFKTRIKKIGPMKFITPEKLEKLRQKFEKYGAKAY